MISGNREPFRLVERRTAATLDQFLDLDSAEADGDVSVAGPLVRKDRRSDACDCAAANEHTLSQLFVLRIEHNRPVRTFETDTFALFPLGEERQLQVLGGGQ